MATAGSDEGFGRRVETAVTVTWRPGKSSGSTAREERHEQTREGEARNMMVAKGNLARGELQRHVRGRDSGGGCCA